jgi:hypothetical protein
MAFQVIVVWSYTDLALTALTARFLKADFLIVAEMLNALVSQSARQSAMLGAAKAALPGDVLTLLTDVLKLIRPSRERRNAYAHNLWAYHPELPDALLLVDPRRLATVDAQYLAKSAELNQWARKDDGTPPPTFEIEGLDTSEVYVYRQPDIEADLKDAKEAHNLVKMLQAGVTIPGPGGATIRTLVSNKVRALRPAVTAPPSDVGPD